MNAKRWFLVSAVVLTLSGGAARVALAENDEELFQRSYDSEAVGKPADALSALDHLSPGRQAGYVATLRRGWLLYSVGRHGEAVEAYNRAIQAMPGAVEARVGALLPLMAMRRWADTESVAKEALRVDPNNYLANLRMAYAIYNLGRYGESEAVYRKLAGLYPSDVEVRGGLGWALLKGGKKSEAAGEFREVLAVSPKNKLAADGLRAAGG